MDTVCTTLSTFSCNCPTYLLPKPATINDNTAQVSIQIDTSNPKTAKTINIANADGNRYKDTSCHLRNLQCKNLQSANSPLVVCSSLVTMPIAWNRVLNDSIPASSFIASCRFKISTADNSGFTRLPASNLSPPFVAVEFSNVNIDRCPNRSRS